MKIQLIDRNEKMCNEWESQFKGCDDVVVHHGDFFSLEADCVVSPANSFGFMDGGLDYVISDTLGWQVQKRLQQQIKDNYLGEILIGQAELVKTGSELVPYCISAPTMRVPMLLKNSVNVYLASKAIFHLLKQHQDVIESVTISGLGTGVGKMPYDLCAKQMKQAYDDIWLDKKIFPNSWRQSQMYHDDLNRKG